MHLLRDVVQRLELHRVEQRFAVLIELRAHPLRVGVLVALELLEGVLVRPHAVGARAVLRLRRLVRLRVGHGFEVLLRLLQRAHLLHALLHCLFVLGDRCALLRRHLLARLFEQLFTARRRVIAALHHVVDARLRRPRRRVEEVHRVLQRVIAHLVERGVALQPAVRAVHRLAVAARPHRHRCLHVDVERLAHAHERALHGGFDEQLLAKLLDAHLHAVPEAEVLVALTLEDLLLHLLGERHGREHVLRIARGHHAHGDAPEDARVVTKALQERVARRQLVGERDALGRAVRTGEVAADEARPHPHDVRDLASVVAKAVVVALEHTVDHVVERKELVQIMVRPDGLLNAQQPLGDVLVGLKESAVVVAVLRDAELLRAQQHVL